MYDGCVHEALPHKSFSESHSDQLQLASFRCRVRAFVISHDNPRGSIHTTIMELGPQNHNGDGLLGPNSIIVVYMDPLVIRRVLLFVVVRLPVCFLKLPHRFRTTRARLMLHRS